MMKHRKRRRSMARYKKRNPNKPLDMALAVTGAVGVVAGLYIKSDAAKQQLAHQERDYSAYDTTGTVVTAMGFGVLAIGTAMYFSK